jgi:hypothetical protein
MLRMRQSLKAYLLADGAIRGSYGLHDADLLIQEPMLPIGAYRHTAWLLIAERG